MTIQSLYVESDAPPETEVPFPVRERRRQLATQLCLLARNTAGWTLADKQARRWLGQECGCKALGIPQPKE